MTTTTSPDLPTTTTLTFYLPGDGTEDLAHLADQRVTVVDYDEVTMTSRVEFRDGYRAVVPTRHLVTREA